MTYIKRPIPGKRTASTVPTLAMSTLLDHAEASWRVACSLNSDDAASMYSDSLYTLADQFLLGVLSRAFGPVDGQEIRDVMADCFEGWHYSAGNVVKHHAWQDAEAFADLVTEGTYLS